MSTSAVNYNLQNLYGQSGPQNLFGTGSNQYGGGWPSMQTTSPGSYSVPSSGSYQAQTPSLSSQPGGYYTGTTYDPQLTSSLFGYLGSQVGQGLPAYQGQLTAAPNELYGQLGSLLTGGQSNLPYGQQMLQMAQTGNPTDVGPAWEAMKAASQQNIAENQAALKEQYAAGGNLVGTPYGSAMSDYMSQTALGENAILTQAQQQAAEAAAGRQLSAQQGLTSADLSLGGNLQQIAQTGATNAYNEWLRTQPQYNPLLSQAYGGATTFPPYLNPQQSPWAMIIPAILNAVGPQNIGTILQKIPGLGSKTPSTPPGGQTPQGGQTPPQQTPQGGATSQMVYDPNSISNQLMNYLSDPTSQNYQSFINAASLGQGGVPTDVPNLLTGDQNTPAGGYTLNPPAGTIDTGAAPGGSYYSALSGGGDTASTWTDLLNAYSGGGYSGGYNVGGGGGDLTMNVY